CHVRVGATVDAVGRSRFLSCMRELDAAARPAIAEALDVALADATQSDQPEALEDLLRAAPEAEDHDLAHAILPLCTHASAPVRHAALAALPKVYGQRAKPLLRDALRDDDESVCRTAIDGLRRVGGIDVLVLHRLKPILTGDEDASDELRALAAAALTDVDAGQRNAALDALKRTLHPRTSMVSLFIKSEEANPMLVEAVCRTMLSIGGPKERRLVSKHAARSRPPLRQRLEALLDQLA
ncbi:MAG: HEAT repeat domain-containing protein, partial [Deltaproteobacteria bacterium]|nr:HEAT repeat domain-containing protein [Deltaproteobacteria bacterium]